MIKKFDYVLLMEDIPEYNLRKGNIGEVISVCTPDECEVKFSDITGASAVVIKLIPEQFRKINTIQVSHFKKFSMN